MRKIQLLQFAIAFLLVVMGCFCVVHGQTTARERGIRDDEASSPTSALPVPVGPYYALVIGNNNYQNLRKLETAVDDAKAVAKILQERFDFKTTVLYNATRAQTLNAFDDYRKKLPEKSNLLIYYAGHGQKDTAAHRAYWLPVDADKDHTSNWINATEILDSIRAIPSRHVLIISDSCWSGDLVMRDAGILIRPQGYNAMLSRVLQLKSRHVMSSGGDEPDADSGANGHSVFANALLESLNDMQEDEFTAEDLL